MTSELSILSRDWDTSEQRSSLENPQTPLSYPAEWLLDMFNGGRTDSGIRVSEMTAFQVSTFLACTDIIAGKISALPRHVKERTITKNGRITEKISFDHDYYDLVNLEPNPEMSGNIMMKAFMFHCLAWEGGYVEIQRDAGNSAVAFWPRNPMKTRPRRLSQDLNLEPVSWRPFPVFLPAGTLVFETTDGMAPSDSYGGATPVRIIPMEDMLHVPGISFDGRIGQGVVYLARQILGLALATEKFGAKYFANFARPGGILNMPAAQSKEQRDAARQSWMEAQGGENSNRIAVMPPGWSWTPMSHNPEEAQSVETQQHLRANICAIFHVPPHMVGDVNSQGRSNTEQLAQELKEYCLDPWLSAIQQEWKRKLFPHIGRGRTPRSPYFMGFDLTALLRPDATTRKDFNASGRQWAYLNSNDIRALEGLNPIDADWAEEYWQPVNMTLTTTPIDPTRQSANPMQPSSEGNPKPQPPKKAEVAEIFFRLFRDSMGRLLNRSKRELSDLSNCFSPVLFTMRDSLRVAVARRFEVKLPQDGASDAVLVNHLTRMYERSSGWSAENLNQLAEEELHQAIQEIHLAVCQEVLSVMSEPA